MAISSSVLIFLLVLPAVYAVDYTVGDSSGWTQGLDYTTWTAGKTFAVGDTLLFSYGGPHSVDVVSKADYDSCGSSNAIESYSDGSTLITLNKTGSMYFICPAFGHCSGGQKLAVEVSAASGGSPAAPTPTTPSTTPLPTTPSTITPSPVSTLPDPTTPTLDTPSTTTTTTPSSPIPFARTPSTVQDTPASGASASGNLLNMNFAVIGAIAIFALMG
ncbi:hypothetical protein ACHQM5_007325 [Ranunculus cassubicifolius]